MSRRNENGLTNQQDLKLEMRALREGWLTCPEKKAQILDRIAKIAAGEPMPGETITPSLSIKAFNALVKAEKSVVENQHNVQINIGKTDDAMTPAADKIIDQMLEST